MALSAALIKKLDAMSASQLKAWCKANGYDYNFVVSVLGNPTTGGGNGDGDGSGGGGGKGGGGGGDSTKAYFEAYKRVLFQMGMKPGKKTLELMKQAAKQKYTGTEFAIMVRRFDPAYIKSEDYEKNVNRLMKRFNYFFPHIQNQDGKLRKWQEYWVRHNFDTADLDAWIEKQPIWRKTYPGLHVTDDISPAQYRTYKRDANDLFVQYAGRPLTTHELRTVFGRHLYGEQLLKNIALAGVAQGAADWEGIGALAPQQMHDLIFTRPGNAVSKKPGLPDASKLGALVRQRVEEAYRRKMGYIGSEKNPTFAAGRTATGVLVNPNI